MLAMRLIGDRLVERIGNAATLVLGSAIAVAGWGCVILVPSAWTAIVAWFAVGAASANVVPVVLRAAGAAGRANAGRRAPTPVVALSLVSGVSYAGGLVGPAAIGGIAHATSLTVAFVLPAALHLATVGLAPVALRGLPGVRASRPDLESAPEPVRGRG